MARKKKSPIADKAEKSPNADTAEGVQVVEDVAARVLITVGPDHPIWTQEVQTRLEIPGEPIVRLIPPPGTDQSKVDAVTAAIGGTAAIKVMGHAAAPPPNNMPAATTVRRGPREVALELAREIPSQDRGALLEIVEKTLAGVGL